MMEDIDIYCKIFLSHTSLFESTSSVITVLQHFYQNLDLSLMVHFDFLYDSEYNYHLKIHLRTNIL